MVTGGAETTVATSAGLNLPILHRNAPIGGLGNFMAVRDDHQCELALRAGGAAVE